jgi:hypothetical protein
VEIEDPRDFEKLHADLRNEWQPVGVSEESEVEQIAVSLWKRKRQWHFENADFRLSLAQAKRNKGNGEDNAAVSRLLMNANEQIETTGEIPQKLKDEIFVASPILRDLWPQFEDISRVMALAFWLARLFRMPNTADSRFLATTSSIGFSGTREWSNGA